MNELIESYALDAGLASPASLTLRELFEAAALIRLSEVVRVWPDRAESGAFFGTGTLFSEPSSSELRVAFFGEGPGTSLYDSKRVGITKDTDGQTPRS